MKYAEELAETCPECQALPGNWCVYVLWNAVSVSRTSQARVGQRTRRLHNGRFNAAWQTERRAKRAREVAMLQEFFNRFGQIFEERG
jgi:hypothetical protein